MNLKTMWEQKIKPIIFGRIFVQQVILRADEMDKKIEVVKQQTYRHTDKAIKKLSKVEKQLQCLESFLIVGGRSR